MTAVVDIKEPVLLVDDEKAWLRSLELTLETRLDLQQILTCHDSREVMNLLAEQPVGLVLLDLTMPHISGEQLLEQIVSQHPDLPVIIVSGMNQVDTAVRCVKKGAYDYFVKGSEIDRLMVNVQRLLEMQNLKKQNQDLKQQMLLPQLRHPGAFRHIVTRSSKMLAIFRYVEAIAGHREPVLITGESGVGKELVAQALHIISREKFPWVVVNAAGLPERLFVETLFGKGRDGQGGESDRPGLVGRAKGGTLFLDEIGDLSHEAQSALLRFVQTGEYLPVGSDCVQHSDARLICSSCHDLEARQNSGLLRKDLFYRLNVHHIQVPPLRDRKEDIPLLLDFFLAEAAESLERDKPTPPPELAQWLSVYDFPGNVRELRNMVFDAVAQHQGRILSTERFRQAMGLEEGGWQEQKGGEMPEVVFPSQLPTLSGMSNLLVDEALDRSGGNQNLAAHMLGITRQALNQRLKKRAQLQKGGEE